MMKNQDPTLIDVVLTNAKNFFCNTVNFNCGLSDCHNFIATSLREQCQAVSRKRVKFRSYKIVDETKFNEDLSNVPFHIAHVFDDIDDIYLTHEHLLKQVIDEHAPIKEKVPRNTPHHTWTPNTEKLYTRPGKQKISIRNISQAITGYSTKNLGILKPSQNESPYQSISKKDVMGDSNPKTSGPP